MPTRSRFSYLLLLSLLMVVSATDALLADDFDWINTGGGFFQTTTNWDPATVPGSADRAIFNLNSAYTVDFIGGRTNSRFLVQRDNVVFDLNNAQYTLTNSGSTSFIVGQSSVFGGTGRFTMGGGTVSAVSGEIGRNTSTLTIGGTGFASITTGGTLRFSSVLAIGSGAPGTVVVNGGGDLFGNFSTVGQAAPGSVTVSGAGSSWSNTNSNDIGGGAAGSMSISAGAFVIDSDAAIGVGTGISGFVNVDGTSGGTPSLWEMRHLRVGQLGSAVLNITNGGTVQQDFIVPLSISIIGDESTSAGNVLISGAGSRWQNVFGDMTIGRIGDATVTVSSGGLLNAPNGDITMAEHGFSVSNVTVGGASATMNSNRLFVGGTTLSAAGSAVLTINPEGIVRTPSSGGLTKMWTGGTVHLLGGRLETGSLQFSGGAFNWTSGALAITGSTVNVNSGGLFGSSLNIGAGKRFEPFDLRVGTTGAASFTVSDGGTVVGGFATIGDGATSIGNVLIDGTDSFWNSADLVIGNAGDASVTVSGGAELTHPSNNNGSIGCQIASAPGSSANILLDGAGTVWDCSAVNAAPGILRIGVGGDASVQITNSALARTDFTSVELGSGIGSTGQVHLTGGGQWTGALDVRVGYFGSASLTLAGGSSASHLETTIAQTSSANGTVLVSGAATTWNNDFDLVVANFGSGSMTVESGASVTAGDSYVALGTGSSGRAVVDGAGSTWTSNGPAGFLIVGGGGNAVLNITNGGAVHAGETIIGDGFTGVGDVLVSGGGATLNSPELAVGFSGQASLTVQSGGIVQTLETFVPFNSGATGHIRIDGGTLVASEKLDIRPGGQVHYNAGAMQVGALLLSGNARLNLSSGNNKVVRATSLQIDTPGGSTVDLADNAMIVDYTGSSPMNAMRAAIVNAYNGGNWNNPGITSFLADATETAVGYAEATQLFSVFPATFAGQQVDSTAVLVSFTRYGDANLDRVVNLADFNRLAANFGSTGTTWAQGDFTFDGMTSLADFNRMAANFGLSASPGGPTPQDWATLAAAVPEPAALALFLALPMWLRRRGNRVS